MLIAVPMKKTKGFITHNLSMSLECNSDVREGKATITDV